VHEDFKAHHKSAVYSLIEGGVLLDRCFSSKKYLARLVLGKKCDFAQFYFRRNP